MLRLISVVLMFVLAGTYSSVTAQNCSFRLLYGKLWVHSHEEDTEVVKVYRPSMFKFPLSRGRDKFEIRKDGTFLIHAVGRSDRLSEISAHWKRIGASTIKVEPANSETAPFKLWIVSCDKDRLTIKK